MLLEALSFGIVEKVNVEIGQVAIREVTNEPRHDIDRVAVALPHFQFVPIDHPVLTHHFEQLGAVLPVAQEGKEIRAFHFFGRIEAENADDRGIAGHDLAVRAHDEDAGKILGQESPIAIVVRRLRGVRSIFHYGAWAAGVALGRAAPRLRISSNPPATKT